MTTERVSDADDLGMRHLRAALSPEVTPRRAELRRAGEEVRRVISLLIATEAPIEALAEAANVLGQAADLLEGYPQGHIFDGFSEAAAAGDAHAFFDNSPVLGRANPLAPPVIPEIEGDVVVGKVHFGNAYEGPPGCVHGGYIAAVFDEVLGLTQSLVGTPGMTGILTVRYRKPTPLHTDLRFECRVERAEGRKIFTTGKIVTPAGDVTCEADGLFIRVDFERIAALVEERRRQASG